MERDYGDEQPTRAEFDREHPHNECDCRRNEDTSTWCWLHRKMWEDE